MKKTLIALMAVAVATAVLGVCIASSAKSVTPKVVAVSSEDPPEYAKELAADGDDTTFWHSQWRVEGDNTPPEFPHFMTFDLGGEFDVTGFDYTPRQDMGNGRFADYEISASLDGAAWGAPVLKATFEDTTDMQSVKLPQATKARFLKLVGLTSLNETQWGAVAEFVVSVK